MTRFNPLSGLDRGGGLAMFRVQTGTTGFIYSPLDTPATASGGVILSRNQAVHLPHGQTHLLLVGQDTGERKTGGEP